MQDAILLVLGGFTGFIIFHIPSMVWFKKDKKLDKEAFKVAFPMKMWIYYLYKLFPFAWLIIYPFIIFPVISTFFNNSSISIYFVGYLLLGGFGMLDGLAESATGIAPIRRGSGIRNSLRLSHLVVNDSVQRVGLFQLGLTIGVGLISWIIVSLLFK